MKKELNYQYVLLIILSFLKLTNFGRIIFKGGSYNIISYLLLLSLVITTLTTNNKIKKMQEHLKDNILMYLSLGAYTSLIFVKILLAGDLKLEFYSPINDLIEIANLIVLVYIGLNIKLSKNERKNFFIISYSLIIFSSLYSYLFLQFIDPLAIRRANAVHLGVTYFSLLYVTVFSPYLSYLIKKQFVGNNRVKWMLTIADSFLLIFLLKSGFMISVIFYLLISVYVTVSNRYRIRNSTVVKCVMVGSVIVILFRKVISFLVLLLSNLFVNNWVMQNKIVAISNLLKGDFSNLDTLGDRFVKMALSLNTFSNNVFSGVDFSNFNIDTIGNHSFWPDLLAKTGLMSILFIVFLYLYLIKSNFFKSVMSKSIMVFYFLLGLFNPILMTPLTFFLFVILLPNFDIGVEDSFIQTSTELVSVIIPAYNAEETIEKSLNSVINQTYDNVEIIVVNDGSIDKTEEKLKKLVSNHARIKYYNKENGGVSSARNIGIEKANGNYICFLDSDDEMTPDFIYKTLDSSKDFSFSGYRTVYDGQTNDVKNNWSMLENITNKSLLEMYLSRKVNIHTSNWIISKKFINLGNVRFVENMNWSEDILFFSTIISTSNNFSFSPHYLTNYWVGQENSLSTVSLKRIEYELLFRDEMLKLDIVRNSDKIVNVISGYRLAGATAYTIKEIPINDDNYLELITYLLKYNPTLFYTNKLRSLKLFIIHKKLIYKLRRWNNND